ncbi:MAG TPA: amidohydrolase family protein [Saprospiraceae bacterium]|nr:amidohydrolase family protein [Saprospiraceae bacterium]HMP25004.1 amidohydrolase family protein [Saprospiraceae bacterium]
MKKFSADIVFPVSAAPVREGVVITDDQGKIIQIDRRDQHDLATVDVRRGVIVPGFVNTHCHLELSHMKGKADTGTGLLPFLKTVVNFRDIPMEEILDAIERADREMYEAGIVAVGDISNKPDTAAQKNRSKIRYYTFVEMFDFLQDSWTEKSFNDYQAVYESQSTAQGNRKSVVPHAPYTVTEGLFRRIRALNDDEATVSIHNQETPHEDAFFLNKTGDFLEFYKTFGFPIEHFQPTGSTSIHYALAHLNPRNRNLFVHNTMTTPPDIQAAQAWSDRVYWATCANANLYIENRLPLYQHFIDNKARMTIGTDSLTSNWQLSVLEEIKTIARYQSYVPFETLLRWATLNGAEALGFEADFGSIEVGKTPGLNLLNLDTGLQLKADTQVQRLI